VIDIDNFFKNNFTSYFMVISSISFLVVTCKRAELLAASVYNFTTVVFRMFSDLFSDFLFYDDDDDDNGRHTN